MQRARGLIDRALVTIGRKHPSSDYAHILSPEDLARNPAFDEQSHYQDRSWESGDEETLRGEDKTEGVREPAPVQLKPKSRRRWNIIWVALGAIAYFFLLWEIWEYVDWSEEPVLKVMKTMPVYSTSLGCLAESDAPFTQIEKKRIPIGTERSDLQFDVRGGAVGTITLTRLESTFASGNPHEVPQNEVEMDLIMRSNNATLAKHFVLYEPPVNPDGSVDASHFVLFTPHDDYIHHPPSNETDESSTEEAVPQCMRFDVVLRIPTSLKKLHVQAWGATHILFDPSMEIPPWEEELQLEDLTINMAAFDPRNLLVVNDNGKKDGTSIRSTRMTLQINGGWVTGNVPIMKRTEIQARGDAVTNVHIQPLPVEWYDPEAPENEAAELLTTTGRGRTDIIYEHREGEVHRKVKSDHYAIDAGKEVMSLRYRKSGFNGMVDIKAQQVRVRKAEDTLVSGSLTKQGGKMKVGPSGGEDTITISSPAGWVGLHV